MCERKLEQQAVTPPMAKPRYFHILLFSTAASPGKPSRASKLPNANGVMTTAMGVTPATKLPGNTPGSENLFPRNRRALESLPEVPESWENWQPRAMVGLQVARMTRPFP